MLNEEQTMIRDMARDFARTRIAPHAAQWDRDKTFPAEVLRELGELGLYGMVIPQQWGGAETDTVSFVLAIEEIAAADAACSTILCVNNSLVCNSLLNYASDELKQRFLVPLASGKKLGCFCLTEAQAGSDASALQTRAQKHGDEYVLNGSKQFITSGKNAQIALVFAVTDAAAGKHGISAFIVPTDTSGYAVSKVEHKMGLNASDTVSINFNDCRIPADHLLGAQGAGYRIALSNLQEGRIGIAAQSVGMARAAYQVALQYAQQRETFGKPIIRHQAVAFRLADMVTQIEAAHLLVLQAAAMKDQGQPCLQQACMAKLFASEMAEKVCSDAIQVLGGYGYLNDFPLEKIYRDVRVTQIYEGTSDIQRMVIAREIVQQSAAVS
jgi:alkylation response protein AidB-like acyl-CoA dehydrogenase